MIFWSEANNYHYKAASVKITKRIALVCFLPLSRSPSRERKRPRWEEERERWSENQSSTKEKSYVPTKDKEIEENASEKNEEEDEELLKPVWVRCTHSESYYSNDPMDQVVSLPGNSTLLYTVSDYLIHMNISAWLCFTSFSPLPNHLSLLSPLRTLGFGVIFCFH